MYLSPSIADKYEVLAKLSEGGMGAVYKVRHRLLDEIRVIKVVLPQAGPSSEMRDRFLREARAASQLSSHPHVARILDFLVDDAEQQLLVLEHIDGLTLTQVVALSGPPPRGLAVEIARQALDALGALHRSGFVHRDIAPDNLMLARDNAGLPLVKLIDLGIAKAVSGDLDASLTQTGIFLGKPRYASPEQLTGEPVDGRSDFYSFGIVLYELLTGRYPFRGGTVQDLFAAHLHAEPLGFAESDPDGRVPVGLQEIVLRLLAKQPDDRFATAAELAAALSPFAFPWPNEALDEILARRPFKEARPVLRFSAPASVVATRRTMQPEPAPLTYSAPPLPSRVVFPAVWTGGELRRRARLTPVAIALGLAALLAFGLWLARPGASGKMPPATLMAEQQTDLTAAPTLARVASGAGVQGSLIEEAEVEGLVAAWQAAQNRGDFAAYRDLYAARMIGIKRVGAHVFEFDRDGWLADRARMFERPMKVHAASIQIRATEQSAVAHFDQSFAQGKFHDVGLKQLVVVREGGGLRIAREEMLESILLGRPE